ncbi:MAG: hypothetical protein ACRCV9_05105 [Burkholderiaceae bacterium]
MKPLFKKITLALVAAAAIPGVALAESDITTGTGTPLTANARTDFRITVPKVVYLRVGTGANLADDGTINLIDFTVPAANLGDSTVVAATPASGDLANGVVTARLIGNNGTITFTSTTTGALGNGAGDTISYDQISTAAAVLTSATALPAPALADGATTSTSVAPVSGKVVSRDARWTYTYLNQATVAAGTYGGVDTNNSRVTYTASMP